MEWPVDSGNNAWEPLCHSGCKLRMGIKAKDQAVNGYVTPQQQKVQKYTLTCLSLQLLHYLYQLSNPVNTQRKKHRHYSNNELVLRRVWICVFKMRACGVCSPVQVWEQECFQRRGRRHSSMPASWEGSSMGWLWHTLCHRKYMVEIGENVDWTKKKKTLTGVHRIKCQHIVQLLYSIWSKSRAFTPEVLS